MLSDEQSRTKYFLFVFAVYTTFGTKCTELFRFVHKREVLVSSTSTDAELFMFMNTPSIFKIGMDIVIGLNAAEIELQTIHHFKYSVMRVIVAGIASSST
jgi:hypothetical protein